MSTDKLHDEAVRLAEPYCTGPKVEVLDLLDQNKRHQYRVRLRTTQVHGEPVSMGYDAAEVLRRFDAAVKRYFAPKPDEEDDP